MSQLSSNLTFEQMLTKWSGQLNPLLANKLIQGVALDNIVLIANTPQTINHYLGKNQSGFIVTDQTAAASIYRTQPFNSKNITLEANATVTINLWVY